MVGGESSVLFELYVDWVASPCIVATLLSHLLKDKRARILVTGNGNSASGLEFFGLRVFGLRTRSEACVLNPCQGSLPALLVFVLAEDMGCFKPQKRKEQARTDITVSISLEKRY